MIEIIVAQCVNKWESSQENINLFKYRVSQKLVYSGEYMKCRLFLYYYLLIIVLFSRQTIVNLLLPQLVFPTERVQCRELVTQVMEQLCTRR